MQIQSKRSSVILVFRVLYQKIEYNRNFIYSDIHKVDKNHLIKDLNIRFTNVIYNISI